MSTASSFPVHLAGRRQATRAQEGTFACLLAAAVLLGVSCRRQPDPEILAKVGFSEIRAEQFQQQMIRRGGAHPESLDPNALLEEMIEQEALYVRAVNAGLDKDPELRRAWRNLVIGKLKERELAPRLAEAKVTEAELQAAYRNRLAAYTQPAAVRVAVLHLKTGLVAKPEEVVELQQRMAEARQKALVSAAPGAPGFGALAINYSEDQATRYNGGIVGWLEQNRGHAWLGPSIMEAGFSLKNPGDISQVITDEKGVYLLKLLERRKSSTIPLAEVEASLRQRLLVEKRRQLEQAFIQESRQSVPVEAHPELLSRIPKPAAQAVAESKRPPSFP